MGNKEEELLHLLPSEPTSGFGLNKLHQKLQWWSTLLGIMCVQVLSITKVFTNVQIQQSRIINKLVLEWGSSLKCIDTCTIIISYILYPISRWIGFGPNLPALAVWSKVEPKLQKNVKLIGYWKPGKLLAPSQMHHVMRIWMLTCCLLIGWLLLSKS